MCLFVIDDDEPPPPPQDEVYSLAGPAVRGPAAASAQNSTNRCWWSADAEVPAPACEDGGTLLRTYEILCVVLSVKVPQAWKIVQLSLLTLWNICVRRAGAERHVVRKGIAVPLLAIIATAHWPPSVRMMAAGFLASLSESADNCAAIGGLTPIIAANVTLLRSQVRPHACAACVRQPHADVCYQRHTAPQPVHACTACVRWCGAQMLHSVQVPLLELCAARNLARTLYAAPLGSSAPFKVLADARAVAAHEGAVGALVRLLQTACGRYAQLAAGEPLAPAAFAFARFLEDDPAEFTRDMCNPSGVLDTLHYTSAALLNLSSAPLIQLAIARRGLRTLYGAQALLAAAVRGDLPLPEGTLGTSAQADIANMLTATLGNVTAHPANRSRLYRLELAGAVALQQHLLGQPAAPAAAGARAGALRCRALLPPLPRALSEGHASARYAVRGGTAECGRSVSVHVAKSMRPKAVFAPILRGDAPVPDAAARQAAVPHDTTALGTLRTATGSTDASDEDASPATLFKLWAEITFPQLQEEDAKAASAAHAHLRSVDPATGDWVEERLGFPLLASALRRPVADLLEDTPGTLAMRGRARWAPPVSEYRQSQHASAPPGGLPARLLRTDAPSGAADALRKAAAALMADGVVGDGVRVIHVRPSTAERRGGRVPLTVLRARNSAANTVEVGWKEVRAVLGSCWAAALLTGAFIARTGRVRDTKDRPHGICR
jgi:hypothetical protein